MATNYQKFMEVLKRWPVTKEKGDRDFGLFLRSLAKKSFPSGDVFPGNQTENSIMYDALFRLAENKYGKMYPSQRAIGATGLSLHQLQQSLSENFVNKYLKSL